MCGFRRESWTASDDGAGVGVVVFDAYSLAGTNLSVMIVL